MAGFYVEGSILKHNGSAVKEIGLNIPDLFLAWLANSDPSKAPSAATPVIYQTNYAANFDAILALGFRVVRFSLTAHHPLTYQKSWVEQRLTYLANLDALIASAESKGILLIPQLFANGAQIPPYFGERLSAIGNSSSLTYAAMQEFITVIVGRYKNSPAIAMWEFGNEYDNRIENSGNFDSSASLTPNIGYSLNVSLGTPAAWTYPGDCYSKETVSNFQTMVQNNIKAIDNAPAFGNSASRATMSGNQGIRARHIQTNLFGFLAERIEQDQSDTLSSHQYDVSDYYSGDYLNFEVYMKQLKAAALAARKPYILGEFGVATNYTGSPRPAAQQQSRVTASVMQAGIQLALLWAYPAVTGTDINVSFRVDETRSAELTYVSEQNKLLKAT